MDRPLTESTVVVLRGRTPFGDFGGSLRDVSAVDLGVHAARGALERSGVSPAQVDQVVFGNVIQTSGEDAYLARHVGLKAGCPIGVPALTVNRLCGSGLQAIVTAAQLITLGEAEVVLAGGTESMSQQPHIIRGARWGLKFRQGQLEDNLWLTLVDAYNKTPMAITAENLAARQGISRKGPTTSPTSARCARRLPSSAGPSPRRSSRSRSPSAAAPSRWTATSTSSPIPRWISWRACPRPSRKMGWSPPAMPAESMTERRPWS
jgi:acetyl-CoA C-acetyltransferase